MPNRILREGILTSARIAKLGWAEETFYRRLMSVVDDFGRYFADHGLLRAACYPRQLNKVSDPDIGKWLRACVDAALVRVYPAEDGENYLELLDFRQQVRAKSSKYPNPPSGADQPRSSCAADAEQMPADDHLGGDVFGVVSESVSGGGAGAHDPPPPSEAGRICALLKGRGIGKVNPGNEVLRVLIEAGATDEEFLGAAEDAADKRDPFSYLLGVVKGRREDAAKAARGIHRGPMPGRRITAAEQRVLDAVPGIAAPHLREQGGPKPQPSEVIDVAARSVG